MSDSVSCARQTLDFYLIQYYKKMIPVQIAPINMTIKAFNSVMLHFPKGRYNLNEISFPQLRENLNNNINNSYEPLSDKHTVHRGNYYTSTSAIHLKVIINVLRNIIMTY